MAWQKNLKKTDRVGIGRHFSKTAFGQDRTGQDRIG